MDEVNDISQSECKLLFEYIFVQDSAVEKIENLTFNQDEKSLAINSTAVYKELESLRQQIMGTVDRHPGPYFPPSSSLHMKLNSRYISKVREEYKEGIISSVLLQLTF